MARSEDSQEFDDLITRATAMGKGIKKYRADKAHKSALPASLDGAALEKLRAKLEADRDAFIASQRQADKLSKTYREGFDALTKLLGNHDESVRGYLGKDNPDVRDFGSHPIIPPAAAKKKKPKTAEPKG